MTARPARSFPFAVTSLLLLGSRCVATAADGGPLDTPQMDAPVGIVSLDRALAAAAGRSPAVLAAAALARAHDGSVRQSGVLPNPTLEGETEDLAGTGRFRPVSQPQTTVRLSQLIRLGGDRGARIRAAVAARSLAAWDLDARRLEVRAQTSQAFVDVQAAQAQVLIADSGVRLAAAVVSAVSERVSAGFAPPMEETKVRVAAAEAQIQLQAARQAVGAACQRLAAQWGGNGSTITGVTGELRPPITPPDIDLLEARLVNNPDLARWSGEIERAEAMVDVARSAGVPDLTLTAGYRRFHDTDNDAIVVGASVPLPLFDRNRGDIDAAASRLDGVRREAEAVRARLTADLADLHRVLVSSAVEATLLDRDVLPGAESAYAAAQEGYHGGKFGLLDVLDAQRTLFAARARRVQVLAAFHRAAATLDRLTGNTLPALPTEEGSR